MTNSKPKPVGWTTLKWYRYGDHPPAVGQKALISGDSEPFMARHAQSNRDQSCWWTSDSGEGYRRCQPDDLWAVVDKPMAGKWDMSATAGIITDETRKWDLSEMTRQHPPIVSSPSQLAPQPMPDGSGWCQHRGCVGHVGTRWEYTKENLYVCAAHRPQWELFGPWPYVEQQQPLG